MPLASLTARDTTAEKIPAGAHGFEAFCAPSGYAQVVCCPFMTIALAMWPIVKKVQAKRQQKQQKKQAEEQPQKEQAENSSFTTVTDDPARPQSLPQGRKEDPDVSWLDERLEHRPDNPRVCDPECPGYGSRNCVVHDAVKPNRPTSPGLLAV